MMKQLYVFGLFLCYSLAANAQIVNIPDANFKNALVNTNCVTGQFGGTPTGDVDTNNDGEIQVSEAAAVAGLKLNNLNIASMTGIAAFTSLWYLECKNNNLTSLTVTQSAFLIHLNCSFNQLASLTTTYSLNGSNTYEVVLDCRNNQLTSLNIPAGQRYYVYCDNNPLAQLTADSGTWAEYLSANNTDFVNFGTNLPYSSLALSNCAMMTSCSINTLYDATVENNPALLYAEVGPSGSVSINNNPLLQSIDLKDGLVNMIIGDMDDPYFVFTNNPSLEFVCMDDAGHWYNEGGADFYTGEIDRVNVSPGVAKTFYCDFIPGGGYNTLSGTIHYDCGGANVVLDNADIKINIDQGNNGSVDGTTNPGDSGSFTFYTSGSGNITPVFDGNYFTVTPPVQTFNFAGSGGSQTLDFCVSANGTHPDLETAIIPITVARPGFDAVYKINYANKGTVTQSGTVTLLFEDNITNFVSATPSVDAQIFESLSWNFTGLLPFENREIIVTLNVNSSFENPAVNIDDVLDFTATLTTAETDETPADNVNILAQVVVGALDPNDKAVSLFSILPTALDQYLHYTVRFQNTGTFYAENVVVRDLLNTDKLDLDTFKVVASSHPCRTLLTALPTQARAKKLEVFYEGIHLPAAQDNEPDSHGFVSFKIKPKNNLVLNDIISNSAAIYFDYNAPIITNTVTTTVTALGNLDVLADAFAIHPNPAKNHFVVALNGNVAVQRLEIYNMLGQMVKTVQPAFVDGALSVDISGLNAGTYFVQVISGHGKATKKFVKI